MSSLAGLQFICDAAPRARVWAGMRDYLHELGVPEHLVAVQDDPQRGTLTYTLRTLPGDSSTLDFTQRPNFWVSHSTQSLPTATGGRREVDTVSAKEIVLALMQHGRRTELSGAACHLDALREHVALRQHIVAWAEQLEWPWPDGTPAIWSPRFWRNGTPRRDVSLAAALRDPFLRPQAYAFGCYTAARLVFAHGVLDFYSRSQPKPTMARLLVQRLWAGGEPLHGIEPGTMWRAQDGFEPETRPQPGKLLRVLFDVAPRNFVPGDWAYFRNPDPDSWVLSGYEGSNTIYLGRGRFVDFYNDNGHAYTYEQKLEEIYQWRHGVFSQSRHHDRVQPLSAQDLERLSGPPAQGGLLVPVRGVPYFFGYEALPASTTAAPALPGVQVAEAQLRNCWR